ncbi:polysaccharide deacetylase family protein [Alicyclobacillus contaminans]|uniref:polysaccharide deacetylase family protein n=1 Tax=Alicyclobacillus contaminans TaxID=392016 RepID=UPI00146FAC4D|nr:polysaccharide deacetylase family protein [Alicyclobacillus contaminans]
MRILEIIDVGKDTSGPFLLCQLREGDEVSQLRLSIDSVTYQGIRASIPDLPASGKRYRLSFASSRHRRKRKRYGSISIIDGHAIRRVVVCGSDVFFHQLTRLHRMELHPLADASNGLGAGTNDADFHDVKEVDTDLSTAETDAPHRKWRMWLPWVGAVTVLCVALPVGLFTTKEFHTLAPPTVATTNVGNPVYSSTERAASIPAKTIRPVPPQKPARAEKAVGNAGRSSDTKAGAVAKPSGKRVLQTSPGGVMYQVPSGDVALTIDDGPTAYTADIVRVFQKYGVPVTFFFVSSRISQFSEGIRAAVAAGDVIGSHSVSHPILTKLSAAEQRFQILASRAALEKYVPYRVTLFRPPYGSFNGTTSSILKQNGMELVLWNRDPRDWAAKSPEEIVHSVLESHPSGGVYDLHDTKLTLEALPAIIQGLKKMGLHIVSLSANGYPTNGS